ncbi:YciI family protein [Leifsonia sp. NPDC058292]|uniref:YciI family protein n=1 Tax=Leifsonia sp. NPDC058292 TaxID=3346428 RepID=UPI0036DC8944
MQYLISVIDDDVSKAADCDGSAGSAEATAIDEFNEQLQAQGHWVFAGALGGSDTATMVDNRGDTPMVTDGPFPESKEFLGGFWIIEAADLDIALRIAGDGSKACNRKVEIWPVLQE